MTSCMWKRCLAALLTCLQCLSFSGAHAEPAPTLRVGVLKFGTVNWELNTLRQQGLDKAHNIDLKVVPFGGKNASAVALQGGAVDIIVFDWIWVSRQRASGAAYTFFPYSNAIGGLVVHKQSNIAQLSDLAGKRLGVAGGPVDKTWLLYQAQAKTQASIDLSRDSELKFAAPPLLNKLFAKGELDAVINFWHFRAKLLAEGHQPLLSVPEIYREFDIDSAMPLLGWVFSEQLAAQHPERIRAFLSASYATKRHLKDSDSAWQALRPLMKAESEAAAIALRDAYRAGIPHQFGTPEIEGAKRAYALLAELGGRKLVGEAKHLSEGTFWTDFSIPQ